MQRIKMWVDSKVDSERQQGDVKGENGKRSHTSKGKEMDKQTEIQEGEERQEGKRISRGSGS